MIKSIGKQFTVKSRYGDKNGVGYLGHEDIINSNLEDFHTQYSYLYGRSGGQTIIGGIDEQDNLLLQSTSNDYRGYIGVIDDFRIIYDNDNFSNFSMGPDGDLTISTYGIDDSIAHINLDPGGFVGIKNTNPICELDINGSLNVSNDININNDLIVGSSINITDNVIVNRLNGLEAVMTDMDKSLVSASIIFDEANDSGELQTQKGGSGNIPADTPTVPVVITISKPINYMTAYLFIGSLKGTSINVIDCELVFFSSSSDIRCGFTQLLYKVYGAPASIVLSTKDGGSQWIYSVGNSDLVATFTSKDGIAAEYKWKIIKLFNAHIT